MVTLGSYIVNNEGQKAFVGDTVKLEVSSLQVGFKDEEYEITGITSYGYVILNGIIYQPISYIKDFKIIK